MLGLSEVSHVQSKCDHQAHVFYLSAELQFCVWGNTTQAWEEINNSPDRKKRCWLYTICELISMLSNDGI